MLLVAVVLVPPVPVAVDVALPVVAVEPVVLVPVVEFAVSVVAAVLLDDDELVIVAPPTLWLPLPVPPSPPGEEQALPIRRAPATQLNQMGRSAFARLRGPEPD